jgi:autotransporter-associated beta strand protein
MAILRSSGGFCLLLAASFGSTGEMKIRSSLIFILNIITLSLLLDHTAHAGTATWKADPPSSTWSDPQDWTPEVVPNGPNDIATFDVSSKTVIDFYTVSPTVDSVVFNPGASAFTLGATFNGPDFTVSGAGIINNSGILQNFVVGTVDFNENGYPVTFYFTNSASAGELTPFTVIGTDVDERFGGVLSFQDTSTAGSSIITNQGGEFLYGSTEFRDSSSAGNATITNEAAPVGGGRGGTVFFYDYSSAGDATIINNAGGYVSFSGYSDMGNSTIVCNGGDYAATVSFGSLLTGGTPRLMLFGNSILDLYSQEVTVASLEGEGSVILVGSVYGATNLTIGSNNLSTTFSGVISEGSLPGSVTKIGTGKLTLAGANTYTGGTVIERGTLLVNTTSGSATGTGPVRVTAGTLSGRGTIAGAVVVGTGNGAGAFLAPGANRTGTLTLQSRIFFKANATYTYTLNTRRGEADELIANGVKINPGASFSVVGFGNRRLAAGTVFTAISNTAATAIRGTFTNLPDGRTITIGRNTFQADYEGSDGNDLTLTVVP